MFAGDSIEEALSAAVDRLGVDLRVVQARKVRSGGVGGFFARERYEVLAEPQLVLSPAASPPGADALEETLKALVQEVETREDRAAPAPQALPVDLTTAERTPASMPAPTMPAPPAPAPAIAAAAPAPALPSAAMPSAAMPSAAKPSLFDFDAWPDVEPAAPVAPVVAKAPPRRARRAEEDVPPVWSRSALKDLGVPHEILRRLPAEDPETDLAWTAALERAIAAVDPRAGSPLSEVKVVVNGDGMESAVELLFAAAEGYTPGTMRIDGREVAATPTWLALAVRSCLPR